MPTRDLSTFTDVYSSDSLMMSDELTSGFDFCSWDHLHIAVMHLCTKFDGNIFVQSGDTYFFEIQYGGRRHVGFLR